MEPVLTGSSLSCSRLERAVNNLRPERVESGPTADFWTVYEKVADERDGYIVTKYLDDLDTTLLFVSAFVILACLIWLNQDLFLCQAGLFSAITSAFIVQLLPQLQPDPADLTNVLLLRMLQQNTSFGGTDQPTIASTVPTGVVRAQSILLVCLAVTLFVAFIAVLGKQWVLHYIRVTPWGDAVERGEERQAKFVRLERWGLPLIMEALPIMLQLALLLFGAALSIYLWDLNVSMAEAVLAVTSAGFAFYSCITLLASIYSDCPFQTPLSSLLLKVRLWRELTVVFRRWLGRRITSLRRPVARVVDLCQGLLKNSIEYMLEIPLGKANTPNHDVEDAPYDRPTTLSNPALWRKSPLFTSPVPKDTAASAGLWLLENSADFSAASAVAAVFPERQWPSHYHSMAPLIRLRGMYMECLQVPRFNNHARLKALQSAAAYYVLYHTQLIWSISNRPDFGMGHLPPDLLTHSHSENWGGDDVFEYLLHIKDRSGSVTSMRFLSYVAPYWFCGGSDSAIRFRPGRLRTLYDLVWVLEENRALDPVTLTDCVLCVGAAMDFPLHPDDLVRIDKRCAPPPAC